MSKPRVRGGNHPGNTNLQGGSIMNTCKIFTQTALVLCAVAMMVASAVASPSTAVYRLSRAKNVNGVYTTDSTSFTLEGNSGSTPTCNDTTTSFFVGNLAIGGNTAGTTNATPLLRVAIAGVPTGVAVDTLRAFVDLAMQQTGPWFTAGAAVPTGWDITLLKNSPTAASDTTGAGATWTTGSVSSLATPSVYSGVLALTSVTIGTTLSSPVGWTWARLRLTGDKTTGTISTLLNSSVWVSLPVDVAPGTNTGN